MIYFVFFFGNSDSKSQVFVWVLLRRIVKDSCNPRLYSFWCLQGIVTGSLPTFIDMSRNFGSDRVEEDNLVSQLKSQRSDCCVFMGDDTWMGLLGDHFHVKYPYPSFNVS